LQVNLKAVRQRFVDTGRKPVPWARAKGISPTLFSCWMRGRYVPAPGGVAEAKYCALLEEDGLLVLIEEQTEVGRLKTEGETDSAQAG
jgi:hypothetical protein